MPEWVQTLAVSDYLIFATFGTLVWFMVDYGVFTPWWRYWEHGYIGYAVMLFNFSVLALMSLIIWGTIYGQRIDEPARIVVVGMVWLGMLGKIVILHHERRVGHLNRLKAKGHLMTTNSTTALSVPDIWYKAQRVLRTIFTVLVTLLTFWAGFQLVAPQILAELAQVLPGSWIVWLTTVVAGISAVAGVISRIIAIPAVNAALTKVGLGSVPKSALVETRVPGTRAVVTTVAPDPKAEPTPTPIPPAGPVG